MTFETNQPVKIKAIQGSKPYGIIESKGGAFYKLKNNNGLYFSHALLPVESNNIPAKNKLVILGSIKTLRFGIYQNNGEYVYSENLQVLVENIGTLEYVESKENQFIL